MQREISFNQMLQLLQIHEMHKYFVKTLQLVCWVSGNVSCPRWLGKMGWNLERDSSISAATAERVSPPPVMQNCLMLDHIHHWQNDHFLFRFILHDRSLSTCQLSDWLIVVRVPEVVGVLDTHSCWMPCSLPRSDSVHQRDEREHPSAGWHLVWEDCQHQLGGCV